MSEEVEGLFSTISFVVDDRGFKKLEDYLFLATSTFSELNIKTEQYEDNLRNIAKATRDLSTLKMPKIPEISKVPPVGRENAPKSPKSPANDPLVGALGRGSTRFNKPRAQGGSAALSAFNIPRIKGVGNLGKLGGMAATLAPLAITFGAVGLAITGVGIALSKTVKAFGKYAQRQANVLNQSQLLASSLGLQQSQILGLADAYKTLGLDASNYLAAVKGVQSVQAGLAVGIAPEQQVMDLAVAGVQGGADALLRGDTDELIRLIGVQVTNLKAMGENGKRQLAVLNNSFPALVKEAKARELSVTQTGRTPAQIAARITGIRFQGVEGGEAGVAKRSAQLNVALQLLSAQFDNMWNLAINKGLPVITDLVKWFGALLESFVDLSMSFSLGTVDFFANFSENLKAGFAAVSETISTFVGDLVDKLKSPFETAVEAVKQVGTNVTDSLQAPQLGISASGYPTYTTPTANTNNKTSINVVINANSANAEEVARHVQNLADNAHNTSGPLGN